MSNLSHAPLAALAEAERIIRFNSYDEITARPKFRSDLTPEEVGKLVKIVGVYVFRDKVACSLPDHTPHRKGLVVETENGYEINIGKDCGTNHFHEQFQVLWNAAQAQTRKQDYQDRLIAFRQRLPQLHAEIARMRKEEKGSSWLNATVEAFRRHCPPPLLDALRARAKSGDGRVFELVTLRGRQAELRMFSEGKPIPERKRDGQQEPEEVTYMAEEPRGVLVGLAVWGLVSIRELLVDRVERFLIDFEGVDVYALTESGLRKWTQFSEEVDAALREAQALIDAGRAFFTDENMALFEHLQLAPHVFNAYRRQRWDNRTAQWRAPPK